MAKCKKGFVKRVRKGSCRCVRGSRTAIRRRRKTVQLCRSGRGTWAKKRGCVVKCLKR